MDEELPQLTMFILPSGGKAAAFLQTARGVPHPHPIRSQTPPVCWCTIVPVLALKYGREHARECDVPSLHGRWKPRPPT
jgi:hypothetical protein